MRGMWLDEFFCNFGETCSILRFPRVHKTFDQVPEQKQRTNDAYDISEWKTSVLQGNNSPSLPLWFSRMQVFSIFCSPLCWSVRRKNDKDHALNYCSGTVSFEWKPCMLATLPYMDDTQLFLNFSYTVPNPINTLASCITGITLYMHGTLCPLNKDNIWAWGVMGEHDKTAYIRTDSPLHRGE